MKILKLLLASAVLCLFMTTSGFSLTISSDNDLSGTEVGYEDTLIGYTLITDWTSTEKSSGKSSSESNEIGWINSILDDYDEITTSVSKIEENLPIYLVSGTIYAVDISSSETNSDTDYFLVKNSTYWALYENLEYIDWGVFDTADLPDGMNLPGGLTVSHVTLVDSENVSDSGGYVGHAPEPSTFLLFGAGLLGLAKISRRKKKTQK